MKPKRHQAGEDTGKRLLEETLNLLVEYYTRHKSAADMEQIKDHLEIVMAHQEYLRSGTLGSERFLTMGQIEGLMVGLRKRLNEADLRGLLLSLKELKGEEEVIAQKKTSTSAKE
jgi:hypothetical protein